MVDGENSPWDYHFEFLHRCIVQCESAYSVLTALTKAGMVLAVRGTIGWIVVDRGHRGWEGKSSSAQSEFGGRGGR